MTITYFSWNVPSWFQGTGTYGTHRFYVSAIRGRDGMDATIRCTTLTMAAIKTVLPFGIEKHEVGEACAALIGAMFAERRDVA